MIQRFHQRGELFLHPAFGLCRFRCDPCQIRQNGTGCDQRFPDDGVRIVLRCFNNRVGFLQCQPGNVVRRFFLDGQLADQRLIPLSDDRQLFIG